MARVSGGKGGSRGAPLPASGPAPGQLPTQQAHVDHSFVLKERSLLDHRRRTPHRRHVHDKLLRVVAHWVSIPVQTAPFVVRYVDTACLVDGSANTVPPPPPAPAPEGDLVNVRALLLPGIAGGAGKHVLSRMSIIAVNHLKVTGPGDQRRIRAYGGLCRRGTDAELAQRLCTMIREQAGLDLSDVTTWYKFVEIVYRDAPPTIFFAPALQEAAQPVTLMPQASETREKVAEEYAVAEVDAAKTAAAIARARAAFEAEQSKKLAGDADAPVAEFDESSVLKVTRTVKCTRTVDRLKKERLLSPLKFALGDLISFRVVRQTHLDTIELCIAVDALDEFLKREMATRILGTIRARKAEIKAARDEKCSEAEKVANRKRRRQEEAQGRKRARKENEDRLRREWADEDEGKTDEEKRESMIERQEVLRQLRARYLKEEQEAQQEGINDEPAVDEEVVTKLVPAVDTAAVEACQYFDRAVAPDRRTGRQWEQMLGVLPRVKIENLLLCLDEELSFGEISEMLDLPQIQSQSKSPIDYKVLCTGVKRVRDESVREEEEEAMI